MVARLYHRLLAYVTQRQLGEVHFAPLRIRIAPAVIREPDVVFLANHRLPEDKTIPPLGADLAMEVVSPSAESRQRDLVDKRQDYAEAGIAEYWIVDLETSTITVLGLEGSLYVELGTYGPGQQAISKLLPGLEFDVMDVLSA